MSFPPLGYPDGLRVDSLDNTDLSWSVSGVFNTDQISPVVPCQGYASTLVSMLLAGGNMNLEWSAFIDDAGSEVIASQTLCLDSSIIGPWCATIPNLGPYMQLRVKPSSSVNFNLNTGLALLTNKPRPVSILPVIAAWHITPQSIAALGSLDQYMPFYWAGGMTFFFFTGATGMSYQLQYEDTAGNWNTFWRNDPAAATLVTPGVAYFPLAPVRLHLINLSATTANATWSFVAVPDLTGI